MQTIKKLFLALLIVAGILLVGSFFLPTTYEVERSIAINKSPKDLFEQVQDLKTWQVWTPWNPEKMPGMEISYSGEDKGVGAKSSWTDPKNGDGNMEITVAQNFWVDKNQRPRRRRRNNDDGDGDDEKKEKEEPKAEKPEEYKDFDAFIEYDFSMAGSPPAKGILTFREVEVGRTRVTMMMKGETGSNPINKYFGLMMDNMIGSDFDKALMGLRDMTEKRGKFAPPEVDPREAAEHLKQKSDDKAE